MAETTPLTSDVAILDLLRKLGPLNVLRLVELIGVTPTAVRQRLTRLMAQGLIEREAERAGRGRPTHSYRITDKGRRQAGANFIDLALALWNEIRAIEDVEVRRGLLKRLSARMAGMYANRVYGNTVPDRMQNLVELFAERQIPLSLEQSGSLPVLTVEACPYPSLAEQDRGICALEKMLFSELLGQNLRLADCRLDGATNCCRFEATAPAQPVLLPLN